MTVWTRDINPWLTSCAEPGCTNKVQKGKFTVCTDHEPLVCHCRIAVADGIGQCALCYRPVISRRRATLYDWAIGHWPELADQTVLDKPKVAS